MKLKNGLTVCLIVALAMIGSTANAQLRFGFRGEVGLNKPSFSKDVINVENLNGFKVGPTVEFMFPVVNLGVEGSLLYNNEAMNVQLLSTESVVDVSQKISNHYIDIPVNLKYKMGIISPLKIFVAAGPYAKIRVAGDDLTLQQVRDNVEAKAFEAGINLGLGADIINRVQIGFNYGIIMTDNYSVNEPKWQDAFNGKKGSWTLSAAVFF